MKYFLRRQIYERTLWISAIKGGAVTIHEAEYTLVEDISEKEALKWAPVRCSEICYVPCRANLHKMLTLLYFNGDFKTEKMIITEITEKDYKALKYVFNHKRLHKVWRKILKTIEEKGVEEGLKSLHERVLFLKLLKGDE